MTLVRAGNRGTIDAWNLLPCPGAEAATSDGPLWVALGDSTSQGIGAPDPEDGWVGDGLGEDKWHPGPTDYAYMTDLIFEQVQTSLAGGPTV